MTVKPLEKEASKDYKDPKLPVYDRVADLLGRMTLEEKVAQMIGIWGQKNAILVDENGDLHIEDLIKNYPAEEKLDKDRELALRAAHETITLLKNENNLLPLDPNKKCTLAVIGPNADRIMLGGYSGKPKYFTTVLESIKEKVGKDVNVVYGEGCKVTVGGSWNDDAVEFADPQENFKLINEAVELAKKSDLIILAVGDNEQTSREAWNNNHMGDRANLELIGQQNDLVKAIHELEKPVVVVLFSGRPISINYIKQNIPAVLDCWYLGQESGKAIANVIFGDYNPGGKLPISIPRSAGHVPCYYNYKPSARRGYLADDVSPLYPFGFGLSYTTFELNNLKIEKPVINNGDSVKIFIDVKNTGNRSGDEVIQLYIRDVFSSVTRPVKELKGFKRISLKAGDTKTVEFVITPEHLAFTNIEKKFVVEPGDFEILVGNSSQDSELAKVILKVV